MLHRDIKPENILLDGKGRVKLADFGIAKLMHGGPADEDGRPPEELRAETLTQAGSALGTPRYMAPEQAAHPHEVDHRADIYSLGVVFYELLTGALPAAVFSPPSQHAPVDGRVDAIVRQALEKERELRQHSAGEMKTQVETASISRTPSRWQGPLAIGLLLAAVPFCALSFFWLHQMSQESGGWNPAPAEAFWVVGSWVGALLFLVPGLIFAWKSRPSQGSPGGRTAWLVLFPILMIFALMGLPAWNHLQAGKAQRLAASLTQLAQAREVHELVKARYDAGMATRLDVIDATYALEKVESGTDPLLQAGARRRWAAERLEQLTMRHEAGLVSAVEVAKAKLDREAAETEWQRVGGNSR